MLLFQAKRVQTMGTPFCQLSTTINLCNGNGNKYLKNYVGIPCLGKGGITLLSFVSNVASQSITF